jgi:hypothetical protein
LVLRGDHPASGIDAVPLERHRVCERLGFQLSPVSFQHEIAARQSQATERSFLADS